MVRTMMETPDQNFFLAPRVPDSPSKTSGYDSGLFGKFGWEEIGNMHVSIPYIMRTDGKYVSERMATDVLLKYFLPYFSAELYSCFNLLTYNVSQAEAHLLNEINIEHSDSSFGKELFTTEDRIINLDSFKEAYRFLSICFGMLVFEQKENKKCGYIKINGDNCVPFVVVHSQKCLPLFYFDGASANLESAAILLGEWDMAYLRFCCKNQKIRKDHYNVKACKVIMLEDVKKEFPVTTTFEVTWISDNNLGLLTQLGKQRVLEKIGREYEPQTLNGPPQNVIAGGPTIPPSVPKSFSPSSPKHSRIIRLEDVCNLGRNEYKAYKIFKTAHPAFNNLQCVNLFPFLETYLLVSVRDIHQRFAANVRESALMETLLVYGLTFYKLNRAQTQVYTRSYISSLQDSGLFVIVRDFLEVMGPVSNKLNIKN